MRLLLLLLFLMGVSCTSPQYSSIDTPPTPKPKGDSEVISYIDKRLEEEYYWLDEVLERRAYFDRSLSWDKYLTHALSKLKTNDDDGYFNSQGQRGYYSYIRELSSTTRAEVVGFGIVLHYTIIVIDSDNRRYGFVVDAVYPNSPADKAGLQRGDIITMVDSRYLDSSNYVSMFSGLVSNTLSSVNIDYLRRSEGNAAYRITLSKGAYHETPVVYNDVIELNNKKIGYLVYMGFESEYDEELLGVLNNFAAQGIEELILDLRCNGGGSLNSAIKLCSAIVPSIYEGQTLCSVTRNKRNVRMPEVSEFVLSDTGAVLNLERLTVICSENSASASELVIMGLRGLDFPVRLIGQTTEGKNCGMDVTHTKIGNKEYEYAPITFMCFNAKGFGDWGEGIVPDVDLTMENEYGVSDEYYPLPYADWGEANRDIALAVALVDVAGGELSTSTRAMSHHDLTIATKMARPVAGIRVYEELNVMK